MKKNKLPIEIENILIKAHEGKNPTQAEKDKVATYIGALEMSAHHPVTGKEIPNPIPVSVDVSVHQPKSIEERVKHIMSVSSRLAELNGQETQEEMLDFNIEDVFDRDNPPSPFEMIDHYATMQEDKPPNMEPPAAEPEPAGPPTDSPAGEPTTPEPDTTVQP